MEINLESCVGRTYERDGERCEIDWIEVTCAGVTWTVGSTHDCIDVPHSMLRLWLNGAVEVEEGK